jgi:hypothetical protein
MRPPGTVDGAHSEDAPGGIPQKLPRGGLIEYAPAMALGGSGERFDQGEASTHGRHARRAAGDEISWQEIEADAERLEPGEGRAGAGCETRDELRIGEPQGLHDGGPLAVAAGCLADEGGIEVMAGIRHEMRLEVVGDLGLALHAQERFCPARVAAALLFGRPLEDRHLGTSLKCRDRRGEAGDPAADHEHVRRHRVRHKGTPGSCSHAAAIGAA